MTSNTTGKREKAARAVAKKTVVAETEVAETEAGTGTDSSILGEIEQNLEFPPEEPEGQTGEGPGRPEGMDPPHG